MGSGGREDKRLYGSYFLFYLFVVAVLYLYFSDFSLTLKWRPLARAIFTALGVSFLFILAVKKYLWKLRWFRAIFGIQIPYIHGRWEGHIRSSYTKHKEYHPVVVEFSQDLDRINVWYYDENAITYSLLADFSLEPEGGPPRLFCVYRNQPLKTDQKRRQLHDGVMQLLVDPSGTKIAGIYYNNPHQRTTYGEIELKFVGRKLLRKFANQ